MLYYSFNDYLKQKFHTRVHRLSLNAGFSCPNRDGALDNKGCIYCNENAFSHFHGETIPSIETQIEKSMTFARERFNAKKFIAYFQNGSNTYASIETLKKTYDIIKKFPDIAGLYISTRPDCVEEEKLNLIKTYTKDYDVWIEYGLQTFHNKTLELINRRHTPEQSISAIKTTAEKGIKVAVHIILGLPGETTYDMLKTGEEISKLPISGIKFHVMHVVKNTALEKMYFQGKIKLLELNEYANILATFINLLRENTVIMRLVSTAKMDTLIAPEWINQKHAVQKAVINKLMELKKNK
ncbi:radical SAM protein, family [Candidatus Omnitrophus magneticus]|uniref:Radical SAM protein, family n=1 Tax=Candidatus Omnitrophus magneticus TaxID=1609969 RepID=A0A0F0CQV6_9BACT|nr:radical SAM protein, family [Candidatus Omnitrophus magneticus]